MPRMAPRAASCAEARRATAQKRRQNRRLRPNTPRALTATNLVPIEEIKAWVGRSKKREATEKTKVT
jgi:hypothetical protein